jgi:hypothetical protein
MPLLVFSKGEQAKTVGLIKLSLKKSSKSMGGNDSNRWIECRIEVFFIPVCLSNPLLRNRKSPWYDGRRSLVAAIAKGCVISFTWLP